MSFRSDVSVNWAVSPRIITVAAPSVEITIQDLLDTLRTLESDLGALDDKSLIKCTGKDVLDAITKVGLTARLLNALLAFEARVAWTLCRVSGGNLTAVDANGNPVASPMQPTAFVYPVISQSSSATISGVSGLTTAEHNQLMTDLAPQTADAVLDEMMAAHTTPNSLGDFIRKELALAQRNIRRFNMQYNGDGKLLYAEIKTYPSSTDCENDTNPIEQLIATATYDVLGNMNFYKVKSP